MRRIGLSLLTAFLAAAPVFAAPPKPAGQLMVDAAAVTRLTAGGDRIERPGVVVFSEAGALTMEELSGFAEQASIAAAGIRAYVGDDLQLIGGDASRVVEFYLSADAGVSHTTMREPRVFIVPSRVRERTAPYVHEAVHVMLAWADGARWLTEGLADHVASQVVSRTGGYLALPLEPSGRRGSAAAYLRTDHGLEVLPLVGAVGSSMSVRQRFPEISRKIGSERRTYAAAFYALSWSFVDYLVSQVGIEGMRAIAEAQGSDAEVLKSTGKTLAEWRVAWLATII